MAKYKINLGLWLTIVEDQESAKLGEKMFFPRVKVVGAEMYAYKTLRHNM